MNSDSRRWLHTPQGTEGVYFEEAYRHRRLLRMAEDLFAAWGYHPVLTPVFDYYETYRSLLDHSQLQQSYRFPDRDGELLMLRSDITLFLAKQMGLNLRDTGAPTRVYYADSILRHQEEEDISSDEFFQIGAELVGLDGVDGDMEVLMLLQNLLTAMKLPKWRMHISSQKLLNAVTAHRSDSADIRKLLTLRDFDALASLLFDTGIQDPESLVSLFSFIGTPGEFASVYKEHIAHCKDDTLRSRIIDIAEELIGMTDRMAELAPLDGLRIDLSEYGEQPYYTGFTVKVYVEGVSTAVASGGRYDNLLGNFGLSLPAAGFSILIRKIESLSEYCTISPKEMAAAKANGGNFIARYSDASIRRSRGEKVALS